jgi:hypothetical protein
MVCAGDVPKKHKEWFVDSYEFGKTGNKCSDIYFNYGTPKWTFSSDDPDLLEQLYNACIVGEKDKETGEHNLPQLLKDWDKTE